MRVKRHPHEGRLAEVYRREATTLGPRLVFTGYTAYPPDNAIWDDLIQGWVMNEERHHESVPGGTGQTEVNGDGY
jgi:hypothetical protein